MSEREGRVPRNSSPTLSSGERLSLIQLLPLLFGARKGGAVCADSLGPLMAGQTQCWEPGPGGQVSGQLGRQRVEGLRLLPLSPGWQVASCCPHGRA